MNHKADVCRSRYLSFFIMGHSEEKNKGLSESFIIGVIAIVFLVVGYQTALFVHQAAVMKVVANRDEPDTVYVYVERPDSGMQVKKIERRAAAHSPQAESVRLIASGKRTESFRFNPNTASVEDLCRLGFSLKQAQSIDNYRQKGGRFRRKEDFARSYVVADSVYRRLEPYIDIPLVDLNLADSAAFDALPGIGGWFASKIIEHRKALGGYSYKEQLLDIYRFDQEKFDGLKDLITISAEHTVPYPLWTLPADSLRRHPYINNLETAKAIVLYRETVPADKWTVENLRDAGILSSEAADKLSGCMLE